MDLRRARCQFVRTGVPRDTEENISMLIYWPVSINVMQLCCKNPLTQIGTPEIYDLGCVQKTTEAGDVTWERSPPHAEGYSLSSDALIRFDVIRIADSGA